jgi:hypothetical protein
VRSFGTGVALREGEVAKAGLVTGVLIRGCRIEENSVMAKKAKPKAPKKAAPKKKKK